MENNIKFVAIYARVSSSLQEEQKTVEAQLGAIYDYVEKHNYVVVDKFIDEGWSGEILVRPQLDQLRANSKDRKWDAVVIYDPDRLARNLMYQEIVIDELKSLGVETLFVTMPPITNSNEKLLFQVRGVFADYERTKIAERFRIGKVRRVKDNIILLSEAPYGYNYIPNKGKRGDSDYIPGHCEVNEYESQIVKKIFSWVVDSKMTLRAIVRKLQELNIKPRKSKRGVWSTSTLSTLLKNETYIGRARWGSSVAIVPSNPRNTEKYRKIKKSSRKILPKDKWFYIDVPSIIDQEIFSRATLQLKNNFQLLGRNKKNNYLLSGKVFCTCGNRRTGEGPNNGRNLYYRCSDRVHSFPLKANCEEKGVNARISDEMVWDEMKSVLTSPEIIKRQFKIWEEKNSKNQPINYNYNSDHINDEIKKLKKQEDRYSKAYAEEVIDLNKFKDCILPIKNKINNFENQLVLLEKDKIQKRRLVLPNDNEIDEFCNRVKDYIENLSFEIKKAIINISVDKITIGGGILEANGLFNLNEIYVKLFTSDRNSRFAKCREKYTF